MLARWGGVLLGLGLVMGWGGASRLLAQGAPKVSTVTPATGATGVELTSSLVFVFDQIMGDIPVVPTIPGLFVGNLQVTPASVPMFDCEWSEDSRTLTCTPGGDLPASTTVNWTLNPAGAVLKISSGGGVALATTTGSFTTAADDGGGGGGGGNEEDPILVSSSPADGATAVPVTATVRFVFDQAMQKNPGVGGVPPFAPGAVAWAGNGLDPAKFTYAWSEDGKTLTAEYSGDLPGTSEISWVLNSATALVKLESEAGFELPEGLYSGSFTTGAGSGGSGDPCDDDDVPSGWGFYTVTKALNYVQESASDPTSVLEDAFQFGAVLTSPEAGPAVTAAQVVVPPNVTKTLEGVPFGGFFVFNEVFDTPAALNTAYPSGNYTLKFTQTGQSERSITMSMPSSTPPTPKISNFAEAQAINPAQAFTLRWNAFTGANADDGIVLSIMDQSTEVFSAPDPCVPRELAVTATSIEIPANTLTAGKSYRATLSFGDTYYFSTNTVANMAGFGSVSVTTEFEIRTAGGGGPGPAAPARFTSYRMLENGRPQMSLTGTAGRTYTLERATRISPGDWQSAGTVVMDAGGNATFEDAQPGAFRPLYYRAVAP
jgi:hypothetical protein